LILSPNGEVHGLVSTYVDDLLIAGSPQVRTDLVAALKTIWKVGSVSHIEAATGGSLTFCGVEIVYQNGVLGINQRAYLQQVVKKMGLEYSNAVLSPSFPDDYKDADDDKDTNPQTTTEAQQVVGELLWLSCKTRADISYPTSRAASLIASKPSAAIKRAKRIWRYLAATPDLTLWYPPFQEGDYEERAENDKLVSDRLDQGPDDDEEQDRTQKLTVHTFADASFANVGSHSQGGIAIYVAGSLIFWRSQKQSLISLSTAESELNSQVQAANSTATVTQLLDEMKLPSARTQFCDAQACMLLTLGGGANAWRTRHLQVRAAYLRQKLWSREMAWRHTPTGTMRADPLTKAMPAPGQAKAAELLGLQKVGHSTKQGHKVKMIQAFNEVTGGTAVNTAKAATMLITALSEAYRQSQDVATNNYHNDNGEVTTTCPSNSFPERGWTDFFQGAVAGASTMALYNTARSWLCGARRRRVRTTTSQTTTTYRGLDRTEGGGRFHWMGDVTSQTLQHTGTEVEVWPRTNSRYENFVDTMNTRSRGHVGHQR
jgi:hypothetical protein